MYRFVYKGSGRNLPGTNSCVSFYLPCVFSTAFAPFVATAFVTLHSPCGRAVAVHTARQGELGVILLQWQPPAGMAAR